MSALLEVKVLPRADHSERSEAQLHEGSRALFAGQAARFDELVEAWPSDVCDHARKLLAPAFVVQAAGQTG